VETCAEPAPTAALLLLHPARAARYTVTPTTPNAHHLRCISSLLLLYAPWNSAAQAECVQGCGCDGCVGQGSPKTKSYWLLTGALSTPHHPPRLRL